MPEAKTTIHYSDLDGQTVLRAPGFSGDRVQVIRSPGPDPSKVTIVLISKVTWWKGIQADDIVLCQTQDSQNTSTADIDIEKVHSKGIQLWKAVTFGIHGDLYDVTDVRSWAQGGSVYTFIWQEDNV